MLDFMYSRYGAGTNDIMCLPFFVGVDVLSEGLKEKRDRDVWLRWLIGGYEKSISLDDFRKKAIKVIHKVEPKSEEEIYEKVKEILGG